MALTDDDALRAELERANRQLRALFEQSYQFSGLLSPDGTLVDVNQLPLDLIGRRREEVLGQPFWDTPWWTHEPALQAQLRRDIRTAAEGDRVFREVTHRGADGELHVVEFSLTAIRDDDGAVEWLLAEGHDITALKQATRNAGDSERAFRSLVANVPGVVFRCEPRFPWRMHYLSQGFTDLCGYAVEHFTDGARGWAELVVPDDLAAVRAAMETALREGGGYTLEYRVRCRTGAIRWVLERGQIVADAGVPIEIDGVILDISEQKRTEADMRLAASVFENSREAIAVTDAAGILLRVNPAFTRITGFEPAEVLGRNVRVLKSGRHEPTFYQQMWTNIHEHGFWQGEVWNRRRDGEFYPCWLTIAAVNEDDGSPGRYFSIASDLSEHKRAQERIHRLAYYDPLTGVPNRSLLRELAEHALAHAARKRRECALLFLDVDHFKNINDSLGHGAGDDLLKEVAQRVRGAVRHTDVVGRLGGDEFIVLLNDANAEHTAHVAAKLTERIAEPLQVRDQVLRVTSSIGIALYPHDGTDFGDLLKNADAAMYKAKDSGRNGYQFATRELNEAALERLHLEAALRQALERGELSLHYQPQVDLKSGRVFGVEALLRWDSPVLGPISPVKFIPIAEASGLIEPIGAWVLQQACRQAMAWQQAGLRPLVVAVNASTRQFGSGRLLDAVQAALDGSGLAPALLEIEITESVLAKDVEVGQEELRRIKALGVRVAVDDFGTGYSSLAYLKRFPLDKLKIDRSFVNDLAIDPDDRAIATGVINLGHSLGLAVIAEGVEDAEQLALLRQLGCDEAQGYYFSRPLPADGLEAYLRRE